jgi:carbon storage regulator CsrA
MLVLSRRQNQRVRFPELGISVQVLYIKGNTIRLGIEAPSHVRVLREELVPQQPCTFLAPRAESPNNLWNHEMRGRLNTAIIGLHLADKQLETGLIHDAETTLREALRILESLEQAATQNNRQTPGDAKAIDALLVEDNLNEEALLANYLRMSGFRVATVHDGLEALEYLATHECPRFVLLDMRLPRCDGPTTLLSIRRNPAYDRIRLFAVSGTGPEELGIAPDTTQVDAWFRKPLNPSRIVEAMTAAVSRN